MIRITALNEESDDGSSDEDEPKITKEAEETIAVSEYMRALKFKNDNRVEDALCLFTELLETEVLNEVSKESADNKMFFIKYNCHKNLGFIYTEKGDKTAALDHLLSAFELDDTDVFTTNKLGQLALGMNKLEVAQIAFEKCLQQNPNHWPSADGVLQVLCLKESFNEAYGWALMWYEKDNNYQRALDVILEIREKFHDVGLEYIENCWKLKFNQPDLHRVKEESVFPGYSVDEPSVIEKPDYSAFKLDELTWLSFGTLIVNMYEHFKDTSAVAYSITLDELLRQASVVEKPVNGGANEVPIIELQSEGTDATHCLDEQNDRDMDIDSDQKDNSNSNNDVVFLVPAVTGGASDQQTSGEGSAAEDSDSKAQPDTQAVLEISKRKPSRRRGSDLTNLVQWGWHAKKGYSNRKKGHDRNDPDSTINGILRRILSKYFEADFSNESSPFQSDQDFDFETHLSTHQIKRSQISCNEFQTATTDKFTEFLNELRVGYFDLILLLMKWCEYVSQYWEQRIPVELQELYLKIYVYSINHFDLATWNLLSTSDFKAFFRMTIFYLELFHDRTLKSSSYGVKNEIDERWQLLFHHVLFHCCMYEIDNDEFGDEIEFGKHKKRLFWLHYCVAQHEYELEKAVDWLYTIEELIRSGNTSAECLELPNQQKNARIDLMTITTLKSTLERNIRLNSVKGLYAAQKFTELIDILTDSLANSSIKSDDADNSLLNVSTQYEVLLEAYWTLEQFEDCLIWSERCLKYALDRFIRAPANTFRQTKWAESVTFVLTYIEALILSESISIVACLEKYYARLIQNIISIVVHQLDTPFDKNNNPMHPINTKMPWVILHHILEREEYIKSSTTLKKTITPGDGAEVNEETLPNSLIVFFTAHEYLGLRAWCTKHNGALLLYIMEIVATRLRAPYLEPFRDVIAEYLEQVTYCLYGYPAKKARARHIEEHNACNVELTWPRAVQLFDIYRPDSLPEFNSYKNDSISIDMEVLLQRIVALVPADIDAVAHTEGILNFINGSSNELPVAYAQLPYQIYCIYYLLADFYFKKPDFIKSIDYYVLDLTTCPSRFDAWAGLALSKASILETRLNTCDDLSTNEFLLQSEEALRCFEQCFKLDDKQVPIWIEYGNFAYTMHSFCSRSLKQSSATLSMERFEFMEEKKEQCLKIASDCFTTVDQSTSLSRVSAGETDVDDSHDEKWLYHYMLGKIAEKRKELPDVFIGHYIQSAKYLYEHNASYPFKISHSDPQNLSVEALEVYYRITSSIIKYIEQHSTITRAVGRMFIRILKEVNASPFALNQAKIDDNSINALKRKMSLANEEAAAKKMLKEQEIAACAPPPPPPLNEAKDIIDDDIIILDDVPVELSPPCTPEPAVEAVQIDSSSTVIKMEPASNDAPAAVPDNPAVINTIQMPEPLAKQADSIAIENDNVNSPSRRGSQESNATTTTTGTTTTATTGSESTSSSSSESSSSDSSSSEDSDSDSSEDDPKKADQPLSENELETIFKICIKNLEECVTRFPEHYKSIYRLANIYLHAPESVKDLQRCRQLLLGTYTTGLGNQIQGLFVDRKQVNLFNGIWRIPSSEIDRPGSFSAHLSKCISILMEVLRLSGDHQTLLEIALQLYRNPESDKRYIKGVERKELFQQAISFCNQAFRKALKEHSSDKRDDRELLSLLIDIYNAQKRCVKQMESVFSSLLIDTYKAYLEGHVTVARLPDNINYLDYAIKLCVHENGVRKNLSKNGGSLPPPFPFPEHVLPTAIVKAMQPPIAPIIPTVTISQTLPTASTSYTIPAAVKPKVTSTSSIVTPTTTQTTVMAQSLPTVTTSSTAAPYAVSTSSYSSSTQPRPRGRPPGSKNINVGQLPFTSPFQGAVGSRFDPSAIAALKDFQNNPSMTTTPQQYSDPNAVKALLQEYYALFSLTGMNAAMPMTSGMTNYLSTGSTPLSQIPQFDIQNFLSPSTSASSLAMPTSSSMSNNMHGPGSSSSTIISVGSGQLTITPSTVLAKQTKDLLTKTSSYSRLDQLSSSVAGSMSSSKLFSDMPGISVTKVKPKTTTTAHSSVSFPKDLPKSLTITPTPAGYTGKPSNLSQYPNVTMQPEKIVKPQNKRKRQQKNAAVTANASANAAAMNAMAYAFGGGISGLGSDSGRSMPSQYSPLQSAAAYTMQDYQKMAMFSTYSDLMKGLDPMQAAAFLAQFDGYSKAASSNKPGKTNRPKATKPKPYARTTTMPSTSSTLTSAMQQNQQQQLPQPHQAKGRVSVKSFQSLQQQPPLVRQQIPSPKSFSNMSQQHNPQTPSPKLQKFQIPDVPGRNMSPYGMNASSSPSLAHSPNKSPVLPPPQPLLSPSHHQISPQKTLQQILAEKKKAFSDTNQQQVAAAARSSAAGSSSASSTASSKSRKSENIIILD